jgi:hypothetical protein
MRRQGSMAEAPADEWNENARVIPPATERAARTTRGAANTTKVPDRGPTCEGPHAMGAISVGGFSRRRTLVALAGDA